MLMTDGLSLKELSIITNQPFYKITYLRRIGKLPLVKDADGKGSNVLYHPNCIDILKQI